MFKKIKLFILLALFFSISSVNAHVEHYRDLSLIKFDIYRNNKYIGKHTFSFERIEDELIVESKIDFEIKKLGILFYSYRAKGIEVFKDGNLIKFNSKTDQNGKKKFVNVKLLNNQLIIDGSSYKGMAPVDFMIGTWWNHSLVKANAQISAVSGRILNQKVTFLGKEKLRIGNKDFDALRFNFSSPNKKKNKDKKLNTDIWYEESTMNWIKASFENKGKWEYILTLIK